MQTRNKLTILLGLLMLALLAGSCNEGGDSGTADSTGSTSTETADSGQDSAADESQMDMAEAPPQTAEMPPEEESRPGMPGSMAADFTLTDMSGNEHKLSDYLADGKTVVLEWFNPGCSVVHYYYQESTAMPDAYNALKEEKGDDVVWLAVISQNPEGRGGTDEEVNTAITEWNVPYPVLRDGSGTVGKAYGAEATPALYLITPDGTIQYNGSLDEYQKGGEYPPQGTNFIMQAINELDAGEPVSEPLREAIG